MDTKLVGVSTARIHGLDREPYWFGHRDFYVCDISFSNASRPNFTNLSPIKTGITKVESEDFMKKLKSNFESAGIYEGSEVTIIFDSGGEVNAIGSKKKAKWIDVKDNYQPKTFYQLSIFFDI